MTPAALAAIPALVSHEKALLTQAGTLFGAGFSGHALLDLWSAAVHNLRRRVEMYSVEIFLSTVKDESGRKKYEKDGETIQERWTGVDELVLIAGATRLGILNKKAGKALEMINWMRNHSSPAHDSENQVTGEDVVALALMLQKNLFEDPMPDPGHSPSGLFEPIKGNVLDQDRCSLIADQIRSYRPSDVRVVFGFFVEVVALGAEPALSNAKTLLPVVWERCSEELKASLGYRYQSYILKPESDESADRGAKTRILETIVGLGGVRFIPDGARASLYRHAAKLLRTAKDTAYSWKDEEVAAKTLAQFGPYVPSICFEEVYQEILAVWCGNFWGRSSAHSTLAAYIDALNTDQLVQIINMFVANERVKSELGQTKPKAQAVRFLLTLKPRFTIEAHIGLVDRAIDYVNTIA